MNHDGEWRSVTQLGSRALRAKVGANRSVIRSMKLVPPPAFVALLMIAFPGFSSFALTLHLLPNKSFFLTAWFSDPNAPNLSSEEREAQSRQKEAEMREELERFRNDEKTKADLVLIEQSVEFLKAFHLKQIEAILGPRQGIQENYLLPAAFWSGGITLSAHQNAGEATTAFFRSANSGAST